MTDFLDKKFSPLTAYIPGEQPCPDRAPVKLNTNESPFPPSARVLEAVNAELAHSLNLYPDNSCAQLIGTLAEYYKTGSEKIFVGNGSDEILAFCFHGFCPDGAAFPDITYGFYNVYCSMFRKRKRIFPLGPDFNINAAEYAKTKKTLFIANPNAPTGVYLGLDKLEMLLAQDEDRLVVVDEAYIDFGGESALVFLDKYPNLLVVRTFSKSRSLAGARVGYAFGSEQTIAGLNKMKNSFNPYSLNSVSLAAAQAAVADAEYFNSCREFIISRRRALTDFLRENGFRVTDSLANFVFAGENKKIRAEEYYQKLKEKNIFVRYFKNSGIDDFVRITVGSDAQTQALMSATNKILEVNK